MKRWVLIGFFLGMKGLFAQDREWVSMMEDQASVAEGQEVEDDLQHLEYWRRRRLGLNNVDANELMILPFVSAFQAEQFIRYRMLLGEIIDERELQAIPGWDEHLVRKVIPYVTVVEPVLIGRYLRGLKNGDHQFLWRSMLKTGSGMLGKYQFRSSVVQAGVQVEKDAGERWWQGKKGISFLSGHLAFQQLGVVRQLIIGDFLINMGQGLVLWQGRSVRKSAMPMLIKRQQAFAMPFRSTEENRFFRGVAVLLAGKGWEAGWFVSQRRLDANLGQDTMMGSHISSLVSSGLHRTEGELADKDALRLQSAGGLLSFSWKGIRVGGHGSWHAMDPPLRRQGEAYNLFALGGRYAVNVGVQVQGSFRNVHAFGEVARDKEGDRAIIVGAMMALDKRLDFSVVGRGIGKRYRSFWGNSFTEVTEPTDEYGLYLGVSYRPYSQLQIDAYIDHYRNNWLRYRVDAPGVGRDQILLFQFKPNRKTLLNFRLKYEDKTASFSVPYAVLRQVGWEQVIAVRLHAEKQWEGPWVWRWRMEWMRRKSPELGSESRGLVSYAEWFWKKPTKAYSFNFRWMRCSTDGYASRVYAYENDVMYYGLIPAFYGKYWRVYGNLNLQVGKGGSFQMKVGRNFPSSPNSWDIKMQMIWRW